MNKNAAELMDLAKGFDLVGRSERHKIESFLTERLMKGGNVVAGRQEEVFGKLVNLLDSSRFVGAGKERAIAELGDFAAQENLLDELKTEMRVLFNESRGEQMRKKIIQSVDFSLKPNTLRSPVTWNTVHNLNLTNQSPIFDKLHKSVERSFKAAGLDQLSNVSLAFDGYTSSNFMVRGNTQVSHHVGFSIIAGNQKISLDIASPSQKGFLTGFAHGGFGDPKTSQYVYATQKGYVTSAQRTAKGWQAGAMSSYQQAQEDWLQQALNKVHSSLTGGQADASSLNTIRRSFNEMQMKAQQGIAPAGMLRGSSLQPIAAGKLVEAERISSKGVMWAPYLRERSIGIDKFGSDLYKIMEQHNVSFIGSMQQTAKGKGFLGGGGLTALGVGIGEIGSHKEPLKFFKQFNPMVDPTKTIGPSWAKFAPTTVADLGGDLGKVRMNRVVASFFDPEQIIAQATKEGGPAITARQAFGEGSVAVKKSVFESGRASLQDLGTYELDIRSVGGRKAQTHSSVNRAYQNFLKGKGSTLIDPGAYMGLEAGTGRMVNAMPKGSGITERIAGVEHFPDEGRIKIYTTQDVPGMLTKDVPRQTVKGISPSGLVKSMFSAVDEGMIGKLAGGKTEAEMMIRGDQLSQRARFRYATSGAVAYSFGDISNQLGGVAKTPQAIRNIANMSNINIANMISQQEGQTFGGKAANFVANKLKEANLAPQQIDDALKNVLAPYNAWGQKFLRDEGAGLGNDSALRMKEELTKILGGEEQGGAKRAAAILGSQHQMQFMAEYRLPGFSKSFGYGVKGTLEPRFFTSGRVAGLNAVMDELQSRATNFAVPIAELRTASEVIEGKLSLEGIKDMALDDALKDPHSWGAGKAKMVRMPKVYGVPEKIYVPSGLDTKMMEQYITASGMSKPKPMRELFTNFFQQISNIQSMQDSAKLTVEAVEQFRKDVNNAMAQLVVGESQGGARGVLRGRIEGSLNLPNIAAAESATSKQFQNIVGMVEREGGSAADIMIMSKKSIKKIYDDAIISAEKAGNQTQAELYRAQRKALLSKDYMTSVMKGEPLLERMAVWRHPGIGARSLTGTYIIPDVGKATELEHYVKGLEYEVDFQAELRNKAGQAIKMSETGGFEVATQGTRKSMKTLVGTMQSLNFDFDGDAFVLGVIGDNDAKSELTKLLEGKHSEQHALRYKMIKQIATHNINKGVPSAEGFAIKSQRAAAAVKTVTPQLSNVFTEMKSAVTNSKLAQQAKLDLFGMFEAAEQVVIHSKHLTNVPDLARTAYDKANVLRSAVTSGNAAKVQGAAGSFFDFFMGKEVGDINLYMDNKVKGNLNLNMMRKNLIDVSTDYATKDSLEKRFFQSFHKYHYDEFGGKTIRGAKESINNLWAMMESQHPLGATVSEVDEFMRTNIHKAQASRNAQKTIVEGIESMGRSAANKLPTKGITGIAALAAAGVVAASVSAFTLGPSFSAGSGGSKRTIEDLSAFKEEMNPFLHQGTIYNPPKAYLNAGSQPETRVHLPPGGYPREGVQAMVGSVNAAFPSVENRVEIMDGRADIDKHFLYKLKNEII